MIQEYAYPWNAPREAIASPYPTYEEMHSRSQMIAALARAQELLEKQPTLIQLDVRRRVSELEKTQGIARANAYLAKTFVERTLPRVECVSEQYRLGVMKGSTLNLLGANATDRSNTALAGGQLFELMRRFNRLPDMARADVDLLAGDVANFILAELVQAHAQASDESDYKYTHRVYMTAATITRELSQTPPLWEKVTSRLFDPEEVTPAIMRMQTEKWWKGRLRRVAASWREHLQIALANVSKKHTPYASSMTVSEWREQKRRTREFLKGMKLEDEEGKPETQQPEREINPATNTSTAVRTPDELLADFTAAAAEAENVAGLDRCYKYAARMLASEAETLEKATDVYLLRKAEIEEALSK